MKVFTLFWLDGKHEIIHGNDITHAVNSAGYGQGAIPALDFWAEGDNNEYEWNMTEQAKIDRGWK